MLKSQVENVTFDAILTEILSHYADLCLCGYFFINKAIETTEPQNFLSQANRSDLISNTNFFQRDTWSVKTLINLFLETGGPAGGGRLVLVLVLGSKSFVAKLLRDRLEYPNATLQDGYI